MLREFKLALLLIAAIGCRASTVQESAITLGHRLQAAGSAEYASIEAAARELRQRASSDPTATASLKADCTDILVESLWRQGKIDTSTSDLAREAIALRSASGAPDPLLPQSLYNLGVVYFREERIRESREAMHRAVEAVVSSTSPEVARINATAYMGYGNLLLQTASFSDAERSYETALSYAPSGDPRLTGKLLHNRAELLLELGRLSDAKDQLDRALELRTHGAWDEEIAQTLNALGGAYQAMGELSSAREAYQRSITVYERLEKDDELAEVRNNLGLVAFEQSQYQEAEALYTLAYDYLRAQQGDSLDTAHALHNLGKLALQADSDPAGIAAARVKVSAALEIRCRALLSDNNDDPNVASACASLTHEPLSEDPRALDSWRRATLSSPDHPDVAESLHDLGVLDAYAGHLQIARVRLERARNIWCSVYGSHHPLCGSAMRDVAFLVAALGDDSRGFALAREAEKVIRTHIRATVSRLPERVALHYASREFKPLGLVLTLALRTPGRWQLALDDVVRSRAIVLDEMGSRWQTIATADNATTRSASEAYSRISDQCAFLSERGPAKLSEEEYEHLREGACNKADQLESDLATTLGRQEGLASQRIDRMVGLQDVLRAMPPRSALVSYFTYGDSPIAPDGLAHFPKSMVARLSLAGGEDHLLAFVLRKGRSSTHVVDLGPMKAIDRLVDDWRGEFPDFDKEPGAGLDVHRYRAKGSALRLAVWDTVASFLGDSNLVFVVPDGKLGLVNFGTFPIGESSYLIQEWNIHYLSSERDIITRAHTAAPDAMLVVAGPSFDLPPVPLADFRGALSAASSEFPARDVTCLEWEKRFAPIDQARHRADELIAIWSQAATAGHSARSDRIISGQEASEFSVKSLAPDFNIVHLLTHGQLLDSDRGVSSRGGDNPLQLSRLAMTGANCKQWSDPEYHKSGLLTSQQLSTIDLSRVQWLVLSACQTGVGRVAGSGEGIFGLRRAAHVAGAHSLIMSLWNVDESETHAWMKEFYRQKFATSKQTSTANAVRQATLNTLTRLGIEAHPYWWGAFVAAGDWR